MKKQALIKDINNMEDIMERTVNRDGILYWMAVAIWHLLQDKVKEMEKRR